MIYNKEEIREWLNQTETVESSWEDDDGNEFEQRIVEKDGELFLIDFCNGSINYRWTGKTYVPGEYEPIRVFDKGLKKTPVSYIEVKQVYEYEEGGTIKFHRLAEEVEEFPLEVDTVIDRLIELAKERE